MAPNYLMAQVPSYPSHLLFPAPEVPGDFSLGKEKKEKPRSDLLTDAILFDALNQDRSQPGQPSQNPLMSDPGPMASPYANPYYAQQQGQQQQQMNLKQAKQAWDMYRNYQSLAGGAPMGGYNAGNAWAAGDYGAFAVPSEGATTLGGLGGFGGLGSASGAWGAVNFGAFAVPEAGATTLGGLGTGGGAGAGGAGAMGALGGLGALAAFAYLGYQEGSRQGRKNDAEAPGEYAAWKAANPNHPLLLQTDAERDDYYKSIYGG